MGRKCWLGRGRKLAPVLVAVIGMTSGTMAEATDYPTRTIRAVIPFASGGVTDVVGRIVCDRLSEALGQRVIVDNRPGASGTTASEAVARAPADGYTLLVADPSSSLSASVSLYPKLDFDPLTRLAPVALLGTTGAVFATSPQLDADSIEAFVALAKRRPGELRYASAGAGTPGHLNAELFNQLTGIETLHVPYTSMSQAVTDLIAGRVDFWVAPLPTVLQQIQAGQMRALAVGSEQRSPDLPDVPTVKERDLGAYDVASMYAILAPAGTPPEIVTLLSTAIRSVLAMDSVQARLRGVGVEPRFGTPDDVRKVLEAHIVQWRTVVQEAHISLEGR